MIDIILLWDSEDDPDGNVAHIAEHGVTIEDVEEVFADPDAETEESRSSNRRSHSARRRMGDISPSCGRWRTKIP
jgi:uncharacterized DUF497 family protein